MYVGIPDQPDLANWSRSGLSSLYMNPYTPIYLLFSIVESCLNPAVPKSSLFIAYFMMRIHCDLNLEENPFIVYWALLSTPPLTPKSHVNNGTRSPDKIKII